MPIRTDDSGLPGERDFRCVLEKGVAGGDGCILCEGGWWEVG